MALKIFEQQAMVLGRLFSIAANFTDRVLRRRRRGRNQQTVSRVVPRRRTAAHRCAEQTKVAAFAIVPDLDWPTQGAALAALEAG
jgi:hypothetical protein